MMFTKCVAVDVSFHVKYSYCNKELALYETG